MFGLNYGGGSYHAYRIHTAKFWKDSDGVINNFIPCKTNKQVTDVEGNLCEIGTIGMYDKVEGKFYTNKGEGTFVEGPEVK